MIEENKVESRMPSVTKPQLSLHSSLPRWSVGPPGQPWFNVGGGCASVRVPPGKDYWGLSWRLTVTSGYKLGFCLIADGRCWKRKQEHVSFLSIKTMTRSKRMKVVYSYRVCIAFWFLKILLQFSDEFYHLLPVWPRTSLFPSPSFSSLFCKIGFILSVSQGYWKTWKHNSFKRLGTVLGTQ